MARFGKRLKRPGYGDAIDYDPGSSNGCARR